MTTRRFIFRCPDCKKKATIELASTSPSTPDEMERVVEGLKALGFKKPRVAYNYNERTGRGGYRLACCGWQPTLKPVTGEHVESVECDDMCLLATGATCRCSCGGDNHGASIAVRGAAL